MAGGFGSKFDPKNYKPKNNGFTSEILKSTGFPSPNSSLPESQKEFSLRGVLGLGQSIEFGQTRQTSPENKTNLLFSHLEEEHLSLINEQTQAVKKEIEAIRSEIAILVKESQHLDTEIVKVALEPTTDNNQYQLNLLQRIRMLIINFRRNISESANWLHLFQTKKRKKNTFWTNVKKKQGGGEQYLFSGEHSASRSAT